MKSLKKKFHVHRAENRQKKLKPHDLENIQICALTILAVEF